MKRELIITKDGSHTFFVPELNEHYHSSHGAIQESQHVYIEATLKPALTLFPEIQLLEIGFGTGLNALLTLLGNNTKKTIFYAGIEAFPITLSEAEKINYSDLLNIDDDIFIKLHNAPFDESFTEINPQFFLKKQQSDLLLATFPEAHYHAVYFDAFAPSIQPELWEKAVFEKIYCSMAINGIMSTYSAKGSVRRILQEIGFSVERLPAPAGKREMLRAVKTANS